MKSDGEVRRRYETELAELQAAIVEYEKLERYDDEFRARAREEADWRQSPERPTHSNEPDHKAISLNGATTRARDVRDRVDRDGRAAQRRAKEIEALLGAADQVEQIKKTATATRTARRAATARTEKAAQLVAEIGAELANQESELAAAIDRGVDERLEGRADTSAKVVADLEAKLTIARGALAGAERAQANAVAELERLPYDRGEIDRKLHNAVALRAKLKWEEAQADRGIDRAAAEYAAAMAIAFAGADRVELRPPRDMVDEEVAKLKNEIRDAIDSA